MNFFERQKLKKQSKKNKQPQIRQAQLKSQYHLEDQDQILIVEKGKTAKYMIGALGSLVRLVATIIILCLAFCGLVALVYPAPREELLSILMRGYADIMNMIR